MTNSSGISITTQEVLDFLRRDLHLREIYQEIVAQKIIERVADQEALVVEPEEIRVELDRIRYEHRLDGLSQLLTWIETEMSTLSDVERRIREKLLARKLTRHLFLDQVREQFLTNGHEFEQIFLYKIVVPYERLAREILYQVEEEEISFFEAAHVYDIDEVSRLRCGFAGKQQRWQYPPEITDAIADARIGEIVGPIQIASDRFMLLLIDELIAPELTPEVTETLLNQRFQEWIRERLREHSILLGDDE